MKISETTPVIPALAELGQRLAKYRKHQGLNQTELATDAGIGVATLRRIEDGRDAQMGSWLKLLMALGDSESIDALLPEKLNSPMADVKGRKRTTASATPAKPTSRPRWGDEQ